MESGILLKTDTPDLFDEKKYSIPNSSQSTTTARINPRIISDATIGLSDGLTVPFALTAGLSALGETNVVIYGGLAELIAGGISMGLGGYLGAKSEAEAYRSTLAETRTMVALEPERASALARSTFDGDVFSQRTLDQMVEELLTDRVNLVGFLMRFHHQLAEADFEPSRAYMSGLTVALGYFLGGLIPLLPYVLLGDMSEAFIGSVVVMAFALFTFGWQKTSLLGEQDRRICLRNGCQMVVLGGVAAGAAMGCVKAVGS